MPSMNGPTTGASEPTKRSWRASRFWARVVGFAVFVAPLVAAWMAVWLLRDTFYQPAGIAGIAIWILQSIAVASVVAAAVERVARRLLPLQVLLGMSLTFPDHAPSRFRVALRSGTIRKLKARVPDLSNGGTASVQEAAEHAIELVSMLGRHERLTRGHTERVRAYSDLIAAELGLSVDERNKLAWAAMLHDIGKLAVPADILNKDSRPTDSEWAILASHPTEGASLLEPLRSWLGDWLLAASEHHERWDGQGYPNGLAGYDISLAGRIVAVADAYDVITSHRSYKEPMSLEAARTELVECAGNQFDPTIVRAMLSASKSERAGLARFAGLFELRTVPQAISSLSGAPAAVAASLVAVPAVFGLATPTVDPVVPAGPSEVAFVQGNSDLDPDTTTIAVTSSIPNQVGVAITATFGVADDPSTGAITAAAASSTNTTASEPLSGLKTTTTGGTPTPSSSTTTAPSKPTTTTTMTPGPSTSPTTTTTTTIALTTSTTTTPTTTTPTTTTPTTTTTTTTPPADDCERLQAGATDLAGASLPGCDASGLDLNGVDLQSADLTGADLRNTVMSNFNLTNARLNDALLDGATLTDGSAVGLTARDLQANDITITNVSMANSTLIGSDFSQSDLTNVSFVNVSLNRSDFANAKLDGVDFSSAGLTDSNFADVDGADTNFSDTNSQRVIFDRADISGSNFFNATLAMASFVDTDAEAVVLTDAGINKANLTRADLEFASGAPFQTQLATYDTTLCPDGVTRSTTCWP